MAYIVTFSDPLPGPAGIDIRPRGFDLDGALDHARGLLSQGMRDVAIQDGAGNSIRGDDVIACCRGEKKLTADLRAVPN
jgi:hypothetical protein